jgi:hypothetical protein
MPMSLGRKITAILLANLILFCVAFAAIEVGLRVAHYPFEGTRTPDETAVGRFDPDLGWSYNPNASFVRNRPSPRAASPVQAKNASEYMFHFDDAGIRVPRAGTKLDPSLPSILLIGGSYTMGHGLDYADTFAGKLAERLPSYQIVNLGVQGFGTDQALLALRRHLPRFEAKLVIYTFIMRHHVRNGNVDRRMLFPKMHFPGTKPLFALDESGGLRLVHTPQRYEDYRHSWLVDLLTMRVGRRLHRFPPVPIDLTHALMAAMQEDSAAAGAKFVVLDWNWRKAARRLKMLDLEVIHAGDGAPPGWGSPKFLLESHPNDRASEHVAGLLFDYLAESGMLLN